MTVGDMRFLRLRRTVFAIAVFAIVSVMAGCGYTTSSLIATNIKTIYIEPFANKVDYGTERNRNLYIPLLEVNVKNAVIDRFLFDGNLKVVDENTADIILKGNLIAYRRDVLREDDNEDATEYRISIVVSLVLWDVVKDEPMWEEPNFAGEADYFTSGSLAKSESTAIDEALVDLARRIVERTIENW